MANTNGFSLMDELNEDLESQLDVSRFYPKSTDDDIDENEIESIEAPARKPKINYDAVKKSSWSPDASLLKDVPEMQQSTGVIYDKKDYVEHIDTTLHNGAEEETIRSSSTAIDGLKRQALNIQEALARHGIRGLILDEEKELEMRFHVAAEDPDYEKAQYALDELIAMVERDKPALIVRTQEWLDQHSVHPDESIVNESSPEAPSFIDIPNGDNNSESDDTQEEQAAETTIIIDKRNVNEVSWDDEEVKKIRRSRTIELNIVDGKDIEFGNIEDADESFLDTLVSPYQRHINDVTAVLPASHYRATFTGLTYAEVIDLFATEELNNIDGERKRLTLCYNHIKNQSIGPWEEYILYRDPITNKQVKASIGIPLPDNINPDSIHTVSKFEDFLRKTSYMDIDFMIWKILCATAQDKELASIKCKRCGKSYEWAYNPSELLKVDSIDPAVLEDMKKAAEADTSEKIMALYNAGPASKSNYVTLHDSQYKVVYGHCSAYEYINEIYGLVKELENDDGSEIVSHSWTYLMLPTVRAFLIPYNDGYKRVTGAKNIARVIESLNEVDFLTLNEISKKTRDPYQLSFAIPNAKCPACKDESTVRIDSISTLLFMMARSLASVSVTLTSK